MAKPIFHAINSAKKFGGQASDYQHIHCKMDTSKSCYPKMSHRIIFHSDFGHKLVQEFVGKELVNSDGVVVKVQDVADQHTFEDLGFIPTLGDYSKEFDSENPLVKAKDGPVTWHCQQDARKWGGDPKDYEHIHTKMLSPGEETAGRVIFHSSFGIYLIEELFGVWFKNSGGRIIAVRDVAEQHVLRTLKGIPTLSDWLQDVDRPWMAGVRKARLVFVD
jgi:hypothetical protein